MQTLLVSIITLIIIIFIFGLLVFIHELGHFIAAKRFGVVVQEFAFGFGKKIWSKKWHGTEYKINLYPLGGYVKMLGDQDGSSFLRYHAKELKPAEKKFALKLLQQHHLNPQTSSYDKIESFYQQQKKELPKEDLKKFERFMAFDYIPNHPGNFDNKKIWQRAVIVTAGVVMNMLLGALLFYVYFSFSGYFIDFRKLGEPIFLGAQTSDLPILHTIYDQGQKKYEGSVINAINGRTIYNIAQLNQVLQDTYNQELTVKLFSENGFQEAKLILNGTGVRSNFDVDVANRILILDVTKDSAAEKAKLVAGDVIMQFQGQDIETTAQLESLLTANKGRQITIKYIDLQGQEETVTAELPKVPTESGTILGISYINNNVYGSVFLRISYNNSRLLSGLLHSVNMIRYTITGIGELISESIAQRSLEPVSKGLSSIIVIPDVVYSLVKINDFSSIINLAGMISVSLAFMNILPIPLLDGGYILFLIIEKLRGRPLSAKKQERIANITFFILVIFTIVIMTKDIFQIDLPGRIINLITRIFTGK